VAHEVVKKVGRRAYRYRVESYRDPATHKVRSRWTYLGVEPPGAGPEPAHDEPVVRRASQATKERLVAAFERLVAREPYATVTAGMVAAEAGLAHGTFYRYFADKRAVFMAALERVREEFERSRPTFDPPYGPRERERNRVREWLEATLQRPAENPGVVRAYFDLLETDEELLAGRRRRTAERNATFTQYLEGLTRAGIVAAEAPGSLAAALLALADAVFRETLAAGAPVRPAIAAGVVLVFDRAIFGVQK